MARIGLVLGAGGATGGAFHAGVLAALHEHTGWDPRTAEAVVGTSAGSITGAALRAGLPPVDLLNRAEGRPLTPEGRRLLGALANQPPPRLDRPDIRRTRRTPASPMTLLRAAARPWTIRPTLLVASLLPAGTVDTAIIVSMVGDMAGNQWPAGDLRICAVRLSTGRRVVFTKPDAADTAEPPVSLGEAVAASCAIPSYFQPVQIGTDRYVDGGVHSPTNADVLGGLGLDLVIVSAPMAAARRSLGARVDAPARRLYRLLLEGEARQLRRRGTAVIAFQPTADDQRVMGLNAMDGERRGAVARQARESTLRRLDDPRTKARLDALHN